MRSALRANIQAHPSLAALAKDVAPGCAQDDKKKVRVYPC